MNGADNVPADALSRAINSFLLEPLIDIHTFFKEQKKKKKKKDEHLQRLLREKNTALQLVLISYPNSAEKIIYDTSTGKLRPYITASLCKDIFTAVHCLSHPVANASVSLLTDTFVWSQIKADARAWTKMCLKCQRVKVRQHTHAPVGKFPAPDERSKHTHVDITGPL